MTKLTFLGTGTSQGVPMIGSTHPVSRSTDPRDKRLRSSVYIDTGKNKWVVDCGPDFRYQMLREGITYLDGVFFTHEHADHIAGLDDIRPINYLKGSDMPIYATERVIQALKAHYPYIFVRYDQRYPGAPGVIVHPLSDEPIDVPGEKVIPIPGIHDRIPVTGYRFGNLAYLTDFKTLCEEAYRRLEGIDTLVINALRRERYHHSHMILPETLREIEIIKPRVAYLTHMNEEMGFYAETEKILPENVHLAYDGLKIESL